MNGVSGLLAAIGAAITGFILTLIEELLTPFIESVFGSNDDDEEDDIL